ncbi:hypothetical protein BD779DRAFT_769557 [Infundibulicybe gibba]|nr:hypothetical protein BD779DRAFT_769557 [Infundibulicybe gibba]
MKTIDPNDVTIRNYSSLVALIFLIWEILVTFGDECKYIWKHNWTPVKCIYLFCRYFSLAVQIINYVVTRDLGSRISVAYTTCQIWFAFQAICTTSLLCAVNALLMLRVYALYNKDRKIAIFLANLLILDTICTMVHTDYCVKTCGFDHACSMMSTPPTTLLSFSAQILVVQGTLWGMTLWKNGAEGGRIRSQLMCLLVRDGGFLFVGTFVLVVTAVPYAFFVKSLGHIGFS